MTHDVYYAVKNVKTGTFICNYSEEAGEFFEQMDGNDPVGPILFKVNPAIADKFEFYEIQRAIAENPDYKVVQMGLRELADPPDLVTRCETKDLDDGSGISDEQ